MAEIMHHPQFYQPTGDLVLEVENFRFRMPKDTLINASIVLARLVDTAENAPAAVRRKNHEYDGATRVVMSGDTAKDWHELFTLLSGPTCVFCVSFTKV